MGLPEKGRPSSGAQCCRAWKVLWLKKCFSYFQEDVFWCLCINWESCSNYENGWKKKWWCVWLFSNMMFEIENMMVKNSSDIFMVYVCLCLFWRSITRELVINFMAPPGLSSIDRVPFPEHQRSHMEHPELGAVVRQLYASVVARNSIVLADFCGMQMDMLIFSNLKWVLLPFKHPYKSLLIETTLFE